MERWERGGFSKTLDRLVIWWHAQARDRHSAVAGDRAANHCRDLSKCEYTHPSKRRDHVVAHECQTRISPHLH